MSLIISNVRCKNRQLFWEMACQKARSLSPGDPKQKTMEFIDFENPTQRRIVNEIAEAIEHDEIVVADKNVLPNTVRIVTGIIEQKLNGTARQKLDQNLVLLDIPE